MPIQVVTRCCTIRKDIGLRSGLTVDKAVAATILRLIVVTSNQEPRLEERALRVGRNPFLASRKMQLSKDFFPEDTHQVSA